MKQVETNYPLTRPNGVYRDLVRKDSFSDFFKTPIMLKCFLIISAILTVILATPFSAELPDLNANSESIVVNSDGSLLSECDSGMPTNRNFEKRSGSCSPQEGLRQQSSGVPSGEANKPATPRKNPCADLPFPEYLTCGGGDHDQHPQVAAIFNFITNCVRGKSFKIVFSLRAAS